MALSTLVAVAMLGILALVPAKYWMLRSWRTYAMLSGAAVLVVLADSLALRPLPALQTGLVAGIALTLFVRNQSLWAMRHADRRFVDAYAAIRMELKSLEETSAATAPATYQRRFSELIARLEEIAPASPDWDALKQDTEKDLNKRLSAMRVGAVLPNDEVESFRRDWKQLEDRFVALTRQRTSFWLLWP